MFEVFLLITAAGAVVCFLKGQPLRGLAVVVLLVGAVAAAISVDSGHGLILLPAAAVGATFLAARRAEPGSYWDRQSRYEAGEPRPIDRERMSHRLRRTVVGGVLGMAPGVGFIAGVGLVVDVLDLPGDTAQIGFIGIPITLFGVIGGALIGYQWVPKQSRGTSEGRHTEQPLSPGR